MKAWRVRTGFNTDYYGQPDGEKAEYFFDKEKAKVRCMENHTSEIIAKVAEELSDEWKSKMCLIARCAEFFSDVNIINDFLWYLEKNNAVESKDEDGIRCYRLKAVL